MQNAAATTTRQHTQNTGGHMAMHTIETRNEDVPRTVRRDRTHPVAPEVACIALPIVNVYVIGPVGAGDRRWVLVDAGLQGSTGTIVQAAAERFGPKARPAAIVMTHGHFDHVGALRKLAERWDLPVYAHPLELPYLTGRSTYPPPDPEVGGGAMAWLSWLYPRGPIDLDGRVRPLAADGSVPHLPGWRAIHTPGHSPGHISLWREADRTLIAGDAFVTTKQESAIAALTKPPILHGPPAYFTPDWGAAHRSVNALAALEPETAATGHGMPMRGAELRSGLLALAREFRERAVPRHGRYVNRPAMADERGVVSVPPSDIASSPGVWFGMAVAAGFLLAALQRRNREMR